MKSIDEDLAAAVHGADGEAAASLGSGIGAVFHAIKTYGSTAFLKAFSPTANIASNFASLRTLGDAREAACTKAGRLKDQCGAPPLDQLYWQSYMW
jgi:hypothetical protein